MKKMHTVTSIAALVLILATFAYRTSTSLAMEMTEANQQTMSTSVEGMKQDNMKKDTSKETDKEKNAAMQKNSTSENDIDTRDNVAGNTMNDGLPVKKTISEDK